MWVDTHCHLQMNRDEDVLVDIDRARTQIDEAAESDVTKLVCVGTDLAHSKAAVEIAAHFDNVWPTIGLHPHEATHGLDGFEELIDGSVVAIGECGLDYFYEHSPREAQREVFAAQIEMAKAHDKALIIHTRDAWDDTIDLLGANTPDRLVIHCFTGGPDEAKRCLDLGAHISISGIVTFKNAENIRSAVESIPLDRLLVETDSPFLSPVPFRGKDNVPARAAVVGQFVAQLKNLPDGEVAAATSANAERVFQLA